MAMPIQHPFTLAELLQDWVNVLKAENKSRATLKNYTTGVNAYIRWCTERGEEPRLDRALVTEWVADLLASGMEPSSAKTRQQAVRAFSAWMSDEDDIDYTDQLLGFFASNTHTTPNAGAGAPFMARFMRHQWAATTAFTLFPLTLLGFRRRMRFEGRGSLAKKCVSIVPSGSVRRSD